MKKNIFLLFIIIFITSCRSKQLVQRPTSEEIVPNIAVDTTKIPLFPSEVIYVLAREYEAIYDNTKQKYHTLKAEKIRKDSIQMGEYLENKLIQLYPNLAYKGMIKKLTYISQSIIPPKRKIDFSQPTIEFNFNEENSSEKFHNYTSDDDEIKFMKMTDEEIKIYRKLNTLADDSIFFSSSNLEEMSISDSNFHIDKQLLSDSIPFFLKENLTIPLIFFGGGSYIFYRKARAEYFSEYLYPAKTKYGMQGDAFRHIFVNVMLKRYTSEALAWLIMDIYWEKVGNNAPCDLLMDLHNNNVGRSTQYKNFRGNSLYDWMQWANNIKHFINDTTKNSVYKNWNQKMPLFFIEQDEKSIDKNLYLYWNK